jgi:hypothetical protein
MSLTVMVVINGWKKKRFWHLNHTTWQNIPKDLAMFLPGKYCFRYL